MLTLANAPNVEQLLLGQCTSAKNVGKSSFREGSHYSSSFAPNKRLSFTVSHRPQEGHFQSPFSFVSTSPRLMQESQTDKSHVRQ